MEGWSKSAPGFEYTNYDEIITDRQNTHWPEFNPVLTVLSCNQCAKYNVTKMTSYRCSGCYDAPPLCPGCFKAWHDDKITSRQNLSKYENVHWPERIQIPLNCRQCYRNDLQKESSYRCIGCPGGPPLCPQCFVTWHA